MAIFEITPARRYFRLFSGYTDMALGVASIFNIRLTQNFHRPYFATSIADFWRRWHISFSKWLMDYIFQPLQVKFRKFKDYASVIALMVVFLVCGVWHGANWTFLLWGLINGIYMSFSIITQKKRKNLEKLLNFNKYPKVVNLLKGMGTFALVCFAWIFFRANTVSDAFYIASNLITGLGSVFTGIFTLNLTLVKNVVNLAELGVGREDILILFVSVLFVEIVQFLADKKSISDYFIHKPVYFRWSYYYLVMIAILFYGAFNNSVQFIYLQF